MPSELKIKLDKRSKLLRKYVCDCLIGGGRGHVGSALSLVEILRVLYDDIMTYDSNRPNDPSRDRVILSKVKSLKRLLLPHNIKKQPKKMLYKK